MRYRGYKEYVVEKSHYKVVVRLFLGGLIGHINMYS